MSLQDVDDMAGAVQETARFLEAGGKLALAVVHPINSGHEIDREHPEGRLVMTHDHDAHPKWSRYPLFLHLRAAKP